MRMRFPLLLGAAVLAAAVAPSAVMAELAPGGTFVDDDGILHEPNIEAISAAGITQGCTPTRYCPADPVTRGQMAAFLDRSLNLPATSVSPFTDADGPFFDNINRLAAAGITRGCTPARYCPADPVTRAQMAAFLTRGFDLPPGGETPFTDIAGSQFAAEIAAVYAAGIALGTSPITFDPDGYVTRAQMASFLTRALGLDPISPPPRLLPVAGNPNGSALVPPEAREVDTSAPDVVVGDGTPQSCTSAAVVDAVARGGVVVFDCGPDPITIVMEETARVFNDTGPEIVIDGGGLITLSGGGLRRILYMNTCDPDLVWTTSHCDDQDHPRLTVQNLTFVEGNAKGADPDGGGAIWARGGRLKVVNSRFFNNVCDDVGPDVGGAGIRAFDQFEDRPAYVVNSTFGGAPGLGNVCSNGGGLSSIGVSWTVVNSYFSHNDAIGDGANPARSGTPGGGSGGAIYNDGNTIVLTLIDTVIEGNHANEGGGAVFFVSNDRSGNLIIRDSTLRRNPSDGFGTPGFPGIYYLGSGPIQVFDSIIE